MSAELDELVDSLLYEGYALYPYTPGATKNATPTPFGIVYPPAYAAGSPTTLRPPADGVPASRPTATVSRRGPLPAARGRAPPGAIERRDRRSSGPRRACEFAFEPLRGRVPRCGRGRSTRPPRVTVCVHNTTAVADGLGPRARRSRTRCSRRTSSLRARRRALPRRRRSRAARRASTTSTPSRCSPRRTTTRCSAPRSCCPTTRSSRPRAAATSSTPPRSRRRCCCTCRRSATRSARRSREQDPAVREMLERAATTTPEEIMRLHGRIDDQRPMPTRRDEADRRSAARSGRVDGVTFRRGDKRRPAPGRRPRRLRPPARRPPATIERIYLDYDDRVHLGVTVDDDPART